MQHMCYLLVHPSAIFLHYLVLQVWSACLLSIVGLLAIVRKNFVCLLSSLLLPSFHVWFKFELCSSTCTIIVYVMSTASKICHRCLFHGKQIDIVKFAQFQLMQLFKYLIVNILQLCLLALTRPVATTSSF